MANPERDRAREAEARAERERRAIAGELRITPEDDFWDFILEQGDVLRHVDP